MYKDNVYKLIYVNNLMNYKAILLIIGITLFLCTATYGAYYGIDCKPMSDTDVKFMQLISPNLIQPTLTATDKVFLTKVKILDTLENADKKRRWEI